MKQLLFVDDETKVLDGLRRMLRSQRDVWECHFATGVDEALSMANAIALDAVVSDINMPGRSGLELLREMRESPTLRHIPILMLTGNGDVTMKREALSLGANDFLNKPFDFIELTARLQNVIALKGFQDEIRAQNALLEQRVADRTFELEHSRRDIILRLAKAAETRDSDTGNHILRVGLIAKVLAEVLGFSEADQERILLTAPLHDVGKIGLSDQILRKEGPLSGPEIARMREHCQIGAGILTEDLGSVFGHFSRVDQPGHENDLLQMASRIALSHHERWDGTGYPAGLRGEEIPIEARIVSVADVYDALRSHRPYKFAFGPARTLDEIVRGSGTQFDPRIVAAFTENFGQIEKRLEHLRDKEDLDCAA